MENKNLHKAKVFVKNEAYVEFNVEYANPEDVDQIAELLKLVWSQTFNQFLSDRPAHILFRKEKIKEWIDAHNNYVGVVKSLSDKIVCVISAFEEEDTVHVSHLYVHPNFQHKGLGSKLIDSVFARFINHNRFTLRVFERNTYARNFYRFKGFYEVSIKNADFGTETTPSILMEKLVD